MTNTGFQSVPGVSIHTSNKHLANQCSRYDNPFHHGSSLNVCCNESLLSELAARQLLVENKQRALAVFDELDLLDEL